MSYTKMGDSKKSRKYNAVNKYCQLCIEEKLAIASCNHPNKLLNQKSEIVNTHKHKKKLV